MLKNIEHSMNKSNKKTLGFNPGFLNIFFAMFKTVSL